MGFKDFYLKEAETHKIDYFLFSKHSSFLPLSPKMISRIFGESRITALHSTDIDGVESLKRLEGSKKSISTFTKITGSEGYDSIISGIETTGGFIVELDGNLLVRGSEDIFTVLDKQGRRWIDVGNLDFAPNFRREMSKIINDIRDQLFLKYKLRTWAGGGGYQQLTVKTLPNTWRDDSFVGSIEIPKSVKGKLIKEFFDNIEKKIKLKERSKIFNELVSKHDSPYFEYDELVVNNIKIKKVYNFSEWSDKYSINKRTGSIDIEGKGRSERNIMKNLKGFKIEFVYTENHKKKLDDIMKTLEKINGF